MVKPRLDILDLRFRERIKVSFFRQETPDQAVGIFDGTFFPRVERFTEVRLGAKLSVEEMMFHIFKSIVISNRAPKVRRKLG